METYELSKVFDTPALITSLATYAESRQLPPDQLGTEQPDVHSSTMRKSGSTAEELSLLLLHVQSAASYYTTNKTLMHDPPPVLVDLILDPFLFNVLPRSLLPTAAYIVILAIGSWFLSQVIATWLHRLGRDGEQKKNV